MRVGYWTYSSQMHQKKSHSIHKEKLWLNWWHCSTALHELITEIRKEDWQFTIFFKQLVQLDIWTICLWILKICQRLWLWNLEILIVFLLWLYAVYRYYIYVHVQAIPIKSTDSMIILGTLTYEWPVFLIDPVVLNHWMLGFPKQLKKLLNQWKCNDNNIIMTWYFCITKFLNAARQLTSTQDPTFPCRL